MAAAALVNPHALIQVSVSDLGHDPATERVESYKPTVGDDWSKLVPSDSGSVWWYDLDAFTGLVFAQAAKKDLLLSEFVAKFKGLSGSTKAAAIRRELPGATRLSTLNRGAVPALFEAMRAQSTAPKPTPKTLGAVGQDHYLTVIDSLFGVVRDGSGEPRWWYRGFTCDDDVPWLVEAFVAEVEDPGQVFYAINHSPITGDPLADTWLCASATDSYSGRPKVEAVGVGSFLHATYAHPDYLRSEHRAVVIHLVCPSPAFTTKGKSTLKVSPVVRETVGKGLWLTTKELYAEGRRRERDAAAADRAYEERMRPVRDSAPDLNDAVFAVMPAAIAKATGNGELPTAQRQLFYVVRQMVLGLDDPPQGGLTYSYFSRLLTEYQQRHGSIPGLYYDPRGTLVEPHTGRRVPLGTREVDDYVVPEYVYDKILYVEKEGLQPVFEAAGIAGRFDLAIAYGKGHATAAARVLADRAEKDHGITVFCLHDADLYGYDIARVLGEETERMPGHCVDVVDLGLKVADAIELDLPTETFTRKSAISAALIPALTDIELEWFTGRPAPSGEGWIGTRVELNAFDSPGLIAYVESNLEAAGASTKIVPPADVLAATAEAKRAAAVRAEFDEWIARFLDTDAIVTRALNELPNQERDWEELVREQLAQRPELWWRTVVGDAVASDLDEHRDDMPARLRTLLTEALQGRDRYGQ